MGCNKIGFETKQDATKHKLFLRKNTAHQGNRVSAKTKRKLSVYNCSHCGKWHITTMNKTTRKRYHANKT